MASSASYPYPSMINVANFVFIKLSKDDYRLWKAQMLCLIESQDLVGFIDGKTQAPPFGRTKGVKQNYLLWKRSDTLVKGWILGSLTKDVLDTVVDLNSARDVWTELESKLAPASQRQAKTAEEPDAKLLSRYLPLYKAALRGDWESAYSIFDTDRGALKERISENSETALHVAVATGNMAIHFVENLVNLLNFNLMLKEVLELKDCLGSTALSVAAVTGNTQAATILVEKNPDLLYMADKNSSLPIHKAALNAHRDTLTYLLRVTRDDVEISPFKGVWLLGMIITSGFFDIALDLVKRYPHLATTEPNSYYSPLKAIARKDSAFSSGSNLNFWKRLIYSGVPISLDNYSNDPNSSDVENPTDNFRGQMQIRDRVQLAEQNCFISVCQRFHIMFWKVVLLVPCIKRIQHKKLVHHQALQLVKYLCNEIKSSKHTHQTRVNCTKDAIFMAAKLNIHEVVEEIVDAFPLIIWYFDKDDRNIFQLAILFRCEKVFNLLYQMSGHKYYVNAKTDDSDNNIWHLAGRLAPPHKLNLVSGAALQMQRELQWFKEVGRFVNPGSIEDKNDRDETPAMVFTEEHKNLVIEAGKWMKDTANSCTIAAALIATVVFAAAITVPGGNKGESGFPIFSKQIAFIIFAISDAISLFTSTTSLLMFLSILTARYAEQDFLYVLPKSLIIGLVTLFLSTTSMMVAFSATFYLMFGNRKTWIIIPVAGLACLPVTSFVTLQFPLLVDLISSTYGRGIFGRQSDRLFH